MAEDRLKILMIDPSGSGGICHYTYGLSRALAEDGQDVRLLTARDYELDYLPPPCTVDHSLPVHATAGGRLRKGLVYLRSLARLRQMVRLHHPDIVHLHVIKLPWLERRMMREMQSIGVRCVMTMHDIYPHEETGPSPALCRCYAGLNGVVLHATENADRFNRMCRPPEAVQQAIIPHGDYEFLAQPVPKNQARTELGIPPTKKVLLFFGYIRKYKGLDILLQALEQLASTEPELLLLVAGKPHGTMSEYMDCMTAAGLAPYVRFISEYIPMAHTGRYFSVADVVVLPYRKVDQSGVVPLAAAYSKPVIVTDVGGLSAQVEDGVTGKIVPPENPVALADAIRTLPDSEGLAIMGQALHQAVHQNSNWASAARQYVNFYQLVAQ